MVRLVLALALLVAACASSTPTPSAATAPLVGGAHVDVLEVVASPPPGGDGPSVVALVITHEGAQRTVPHALGGVAYGSAALVLFEDHALSRLTAEPDGVQPLDEHVDFVPVVSPRGDAYAYARSDDGLAHALVVSDAQGARVLAEGLASIGALAFVGDRLVFVGARSGGVAGLWVAGLRGSERAVCVTNCTLRTGEPWGDAFVPPPADAATLALEGAALSWTDGEGVAHTARVPAP